MLVVLRDGRKLFGVLRSYDQFGAHDRHNLLVFFFAKTNYQCVFFVWWLPYSTTTTTTTTPLSGFTANLVLEDTVERIYHQDVFAEQWVGLFLIRGENVVLLGEIVSTAKSPPSSHPLMLRVCVAELSFSQFLITFPRLLGS